MGNKFTLILNREISEDESGILREAGCADATVTSVTVPGTDDTVVSQLEFDTDAGPSLAEAIEAALAAVEKVPDLTVPTLTVPAQPAAAQPAENGTAPEPAALEAGEPGANAAQSSEATVAIGASSD
jgi:hypothetical protein